MPFFRVPNKETVLERAMTFYYLMKGPNWHTIAWDSYRYFGSGGKDGEKMPTSSFS